MHSATESLFPRELQIAYAFVGVIWIVSTPLAGGELIFNIALITLSFPDKGEPFVFVNELMTASFAFPLFWSKVISKSVTYTLLFSREFAVNRG